MDQRDTIRKEVLGALKEGEQDGSIREMEYRMIRNVFSFMDQDAKDVMTHRKNIVALNCDDTLEEAAAFASKAKNSGSRSTRRKSIISWGLYISGIL